MQLDKALREAGIEIPFPQRDLHLRSMDTNIPIGNGDFPKPE
jgi:potassium efflux system protein